MRWIEEKVAAPLRMVASAGDAVAVTRWRKSLEFLIRRKIGQKGFPGAHMFQNALDQGWPKIVTMADKKGFEIAKELNS